MDFVAADRFFSPVGLHLVDIVAPDRFHGFRLATFAFRGFVFPLDFGFLLFGFGLVCFLVLGDQLLAVGDGNLIIVRMNFAKRQETVAIAAIIDERRLQRRLHTGDFREIDIAF